MLNLENRMRSSSSGLRKGAWTEEEDTLLRECIEKYGEGKWHQIPDRAGLKRCRKSCRLRWLNYLSPNIKRGNFSSDEVDLIIRLHKLLGNRWSLIAGRIPGRTANDVKNYWNTHLNKKLPSGGNIKKKFSDGGNYNKGKGSKTITASTIIKPQPRTFSKNVPWLREKAANDDETSSKINHETEGTDAVPKSIFIAIDDDMQWMDKLLNDTETTSQGQRGPLTVSVVGEERIGSLWNEEIEPGAKQSDELIPKWQDGLENFCFDGDLWNLLISEQSVSS